MDFKRLSLIKPIPTNVGQWAAVAIIIDNSRNSTLIVKRIARRNDPWSGDVAFPGGRYNSVDRDLVETAIRETLEETGIDLNSSNFMGTMEIYKPSNELLVKVLPVVFYANKIDNVKISKEELESFYWLPLDLRNTTLLKQKMKGFYENWTLIYNGITIWGMTYRILKSLLETLNLGTIPWENVGGS
ncbi:MAG: CoA pyrophosphatase [Conexivisphaerales archaeon]